MKIEIDNIMGTALYNLHNWNLEYIYPNDADVEDIEEESILIDYVSDLRGFHLSEGFEASTPIAIKKMKAMGFKMIQLTGDGCNNRYRLLTIPSGSQIVINGIQRLADDDNKPYTRIELSVILPKPITMRSSTYKYLQIYIPATQFDNMDWSKTPIKKAKSKGFYYSRYGGLL